MKKRLIIEVVLAIVIVGLVIMVIRSVMEPVKFKSEKDFRYENTIQTLLVDHFSIDMLLPTVIQSKSL